MSKIEAIKAVYGNKTDLKNRLSYSAGVKNMVGVQSTNLQMGIKITNDTDDAVLVYLTPSRLIGFDVVNVQNNLGASPVAFADNKNSLGLFKKVLQLQGLPSGIPFACATYYPDDTVTAKKVTIKTTNPNQDLSLLATSMNETPIQITGINFRSFDANGNPENTNYGNSMSIHNINAYRPSKQSALINLSDYQGSKDFSTEILKIDLLKHNIVMGVSQEDIVGILVNSGTRLHISMSIGARDSRTERFHRDIQEGTAMILNEFELGGSDCNC